MRRARAALLAATFASFALSGLAAPAHACMGPVCEAICEVQAHPAVQKYTALDDCIVK